AGRPELAVALYEGYLKWRKTLLAPGDTTLVYSMNDLAEAYEVSGRNEHALALREEAFRFAKDKLGPDHGRTLQVMSWVAFHHQRTGRLDLALPLFEEALNLARAKWGPEDPDGAIYDHMNQLAGAYLAARRYEEAVQLSRELLASH